MSSLSHLPPGFPRSRRRERPGAGRRGPVRRGFGWTLGGVAALAVAFALFELKGIVVAIFIAAFVTVGLDPLVRWLQRHHFRRGLALFTVIILVVAVMVAIIWVVVPIVVDQVQSLAVSIPKEIQQLKDAGWFDPANQASNGVLGEFFSWLAQFIANPQVWAAVANGVVDFGLSLVSAISGFFFIFVLVIYFLGTYDVTKTAAYKMVSASHRDTFVSFSERIIQNVGKYLSGMVTVAFINSVWTFLLLLVTGVPGAFLIAVVAFFVTMIPLVGTIITTIGMTIIAFIHSPVSALIVLIAMLVYMQVESYVIDPRVMGKAVQVPGSVVLISAMAGGALFGLVGALVAIPISASVILIIREVVWPAKQRA